MRYILTAAEMEAIMEQHLGKKVIGAIDEYAFESVDQLTPAATPDVVYQEACDAWDAQRETIARNGIGKA